MNGKKLNLKWVSETIGEDYKLWNNGDIITIQAQTGTGKTFFITGNDKDKGLIDYIGDKSLAYICNRIELKRQIKIDLLKKYNELYRIEADEDTEKNDIIKIKNYEGKMYFCDLHKLDTLVKVKNIAILSYHGIAEGELDNIYLKRSNNLHNFDYIVCDECHFFLTDSDFYNKTHLSFFPIVRLHYPNSKRIFISATMDEVFPTIVAAYENIHENIDSNIKLWDKYTTGIDYSYLNIKYFRDIKSIPKLIKNDDTDEKWIIFVTSKEIGNKLRESLLNNGISSEFIHAKNNSSEKKNITSSGEFESKVLISTKCLDNGVNIKDDSVNNVIIMAHDKTTFIQELGRIRIKVNDSRDVNLFIPMLDKRTFLGKLNLYKDKDEQLKLLSENQVKFKRKFNDDLIRLKTDLFYLNESGDWKINQLGHARLTKDKNFAKYMIARFEGYIEMIDGNFEFIENNEDKFAYIKEQLEWLGLEYTFDIENLIKDIVDNEEVKKLKNYLESIEGKKLFGEDQQELSNLVIRELITIGKDTDYRVKKLKPSTLEKIIRNQLELNYVVSKSKKESKGELRGKRYIIIKRF
ncbi:MAG: DEAD/DEAH box helicase family protein [Paraclostridium bifermentans]|uniref:helicase-related protein n=1 Tax=Paraclostridium bifermentans TaxID=1490 RepID=UPI001D6BF3A7|nr:helicase-related protein [Paraclostridium bifermentans]MBS6509812.1 DEAD/DEAH box helicase family protein [Paraclostridium bifermentans]